MAISVSVYQENTLINPVDHHSLVLTEADTTISERLEKAFKNALTHSEPELDDVRWVGSAIASTCTYFEKALLCGLLNLDPVTTMREYSHTSFNRVILNHGTNIDAKHGLQVANNFHILGDLTRIAEFYVLSAYLFAQFGNPDTSKQILNSVNSKELSQWGKYYANKTARMIREARSPLFVLVS